MGATGALLLAAWTGAQLVGCDDGATPGDDAGRDASAIDASADATPSGDAILADATALPDAGPACEPQAITGCADDCVTPVGAYWDGSYCRPILCCCEGPDCASTYDTVEACTAAHTDCPADACAEASGYCDPGDFAEPICADGWGNDAWHGTGTAAPCGLGICCTPCPDAADPHVEYVGTSAAECAAMDWAGCGEHQTLFDNECGCGCVTDELQVGDSCGAGSFGCPDHLVCCYPCGIPGCEDVCMVPCEDDGGACSGGCPNLP